MEESTGNWAPDRQPSCAVFVSKRSLRIEGQFPEASKRDATVAARVGEMSVSSRKGPPRGTRGGHLRLATSRITQCQSTSRSSSESAKALALGRRGHSVLFPHRCILIGCGGRCPDRLLIIGIKVAVLDTGKRAAGWGLRAVPQLPVFGLPANPAARKMRPESPTAMKVTRGATARTSCALTRPAENVLN